MASPTKAHGSVTLSPYGYRSGHAGFRFRIVGGYAPTAGTSLGIDFGPRMFADITDQLGRLKDSLVFSPANRKVQKKIAELAEESVERNFSLRRDNASARWKPLAMMTRAERVTQGFRPNRPVLVRSGALFEAATSNLRTFTAGDSLLSIVPTVFPRNTYDARSEVQSERYFDTHNDGGKSGYTTGKGGPRKNVPKRTFFYLSMKDLVVVADLMVVNMCRAATAVAKGSGGNRAAQAIKASFDFRVNELRVSNAEFRSGSSMEKAILVGKKRVRNAR